jgi:hypothetical protein
MRSRAAVVFAVTLAGGLLGCSRPTTGALFIVEGDGVRVPADVDAIHVRVSDDSGAVDYDRVLPACSGARDGSCFKLPERFLLVPGPLAPGAIVTLRLEAISAGQVVIANQMQFRFSPDRLLQIPMSLYATCLGNTSCAPRGLICGPDGSCQAPPQVGSPLDGGGSPLDAAIVSNSPRDLGPSSDLESPRIQHDFGHASLEDLSPAEHEHDLSHLRDLAAPQDLAVACGDIAQPCCAGQQCLFGYSCNLQLQVCGEFP